jgi:hypothetical protein
MAKTMNPDLPTKEQIRISALLVSSKLDKYIELHDLILKRGGSLAYLSLSISLSNGQKTRKRTILCHKRHSLNEG